MEVLSLIPADYAAANEGGKFTLVGAGFNELKPEKLPYIHPLMFLLVRLKVTKDDAGKNRIAIRLMGEKGALFKAQLDIDVKPDDVLREHFVNIPCQINSLRFQTEGEYSFEVEVNGKTTSQLLVVKNKGAV